jgi:hypothetical protein
MNKGHTGRSDKPLVRQLKRQSSHKSGKFKMPKVTKRRKTVPKKRGTRGHRSDLFLKFHLDKGEKENGNAIFDHIQTITSDRLCLQVVKSGVTEFTQCKCLARLGHLVRNATENPQQAPQQAEWKAMFAKFARVLKSVCQKPREVSSLVQFMYQFHHTYKKNRQVKVMQYVVPTPDASGPLAMDFNGIAELGGRNHRKAYCEFYQHFLTQDEPKKGEEGNFIPSNAKAYARDVC